MKKIIGLIACLCLGMFGFINLSYALPGNYQNSCNSCQFFGGRLQCSCQRADGSMRYSSLRDADGCSFIENINGQLTCTGQSRINYLPGGSYQQTCRNCNFDGSRLSCQCQTRNQWQALYTTLMNVQSCRPGSIQNINGTLRCYRGVPSSLPRGDYRQTCINCNFDGNNLTCLCRKRNQRWRFSMLMGAGQCWRVSNDNGHLYCNAQ